MKGFIISLKIVYGAFKSFKVRTALAVFGVLLGAFSLVLVTNISKSLKIKVNNEVSKFGSNIFTVMSGNVNRHGRPVFFTKAKTMTFEDAQMIRDNVGNVLEISPFVKKNGAVRYEVTNISTTVLGVDISYEKMKELEIAEGSFFKSSDVKNMERVCVIGFEVKKKLFGEESAVGKTILLYRAPFKVVGTLQEKGSDLNGTNADDMIYVPITTLMRRASNITNIDGVEVSISDWSKFEGVKNSIEPILRKNHNIIDGKKDDFVVVNPIDAIEMQNKTLNIVSFLGQITAGISFLIGGLGIFSIMILAVSVRKMEIGIKRAVGAKRRDILKQFLLEAGIIGSLGSIIGVVISLGVSTIVYVFAKLPVAYSVSGIVFALLSSIFVGTISGLYPALLASRVNPIEALKL